MENQNLLCMKKFDVASDTFLSSILEQKVSFDSTHINIELLFHCKRCQLTQTQRSHAKGMETSPHALNCSLWIEKTAEKYEKYIKFRFHTLQLWGVAGTVTSKSVNNLLTPNVFYK